MARKAREKSDFGIYHIQQIGGGCRPLFLNAEDRYKFLNILTTNQKKFNFLLYGYCLADTDQYDIILDVNGSDVSMIMKSINIAYAMYTSCEGKLFHSRFKSHLLDEESLSLALEQIKSKETHFLNQLDELRIDPCFNQCFNVIKTSSYSILDPDECDQCIQCMESARTTIESMMKAKGFSFEHILKDKDLRNQLILDFRKGSTLSLKAIGELLGGLSESTISKIIKNA